MASVQYDQVPIRLQLSLVSNPPVFPVDANTGLQPQFFRAQPVAFQIGIFDSNNVAVDLGNLDYLLFSLYPISNLLSPTVPLATVQVMQADIIDVISWADWQNGTAQQAIARFTAAQLDQSLDATEQKLYRFVVQGYVTGTGTFITYGAGPVTLFNPSNSLPPPETFNTTSYNEQTLSSGNITISPSSQNHTEIVTVNGSARTSNIIVSVAGVSEGAQCQIRLNLPNTPNIIIALISGNTGLPQIFPLSIYTSGGSPNAIWRIVYDGTEWVPVEALLPAY